MIPKSKFTRDSGRLLERHVESVMERGAGLGERVRVLVSDLLSIRAALIAVAALIFNLSVAQTTWTGAGTNYFWNNSANWGGSLPANSTANTNVITFNGAVTQMTPFVNATWSVGELNFLGSSAYIVGGNSTLTIGGNATGVGIANGGSAKESIVVPITLSASQTWLTNSTGSLQVGGNGTVNLGANTLTLNPGSSGSISILDPIVGTGALVVNSTSGLGVTTLRGTNTFSGGVTLGNSTNSGGTLNINSGTALGTGTFVASNSTIDNTSGNALRLVNNNAITLNGNLTFTGTGNLDLGTGAVTLGTTTTHNVTVSANTLAIGGNISGTSNLIKSGSGTLTLSGANTFGNATTGGVVLNAGTLNINSATALGAATANFTIAGGTIDNTSGANIVISNNNVQKWNGNFTFTGTNDLNLGTGAVTMNAARTITTTGGNLTVGGAIGGSFALTKVGAGTLTLNGTNTFNGGFTAGNGTTTGGTVNINNAAALGTGTFTVANATTIDNTSGSTLTITNAQAWNANVTFTGTNDLTSSGAITLGANQTLTTNDGNLTLNGNIGGNQFNLTKNGAGTLTLAGNNNFGNATVGGVILNAGTLNINSANALGAAVAAFTINGGTIDNTSGSTFTTGNNPQNWNGDFTFAGTGNLTFGTGAVTMNATRTLTVNNSTLTVGGSIGGTGFGIIKNGNGTLALSGSASSYTGNVTLNAGTLALNSARALGNITNAGTLVINGGALDNTSGANVTLSTNNAQQWNGNFTYTGTGNLNLGTGAVTMNASRTVTVSNNTLTVGGAIGDGGSGFGLTKTGAGTLTLASAAANTYSGATTVTGGTLALNMANMGTPTNLISSSSALILGGGTLSVTGQGVNNVVSSQTFNTATFNAGSSSIVAVTGTGGNSGTKTNVVLSSITRNAGATVDFTLPTTGNIVLTGNKSATFLGAWATVGGANWAATDANGNITTATLTNNTYSSGTNTLANRSVSLTNNTTNSLLFGNATAATITVTGNLTVQSGGILVNSTVANNASTITGGNLQANAGNELVITNNDASSNLTISSVIQNNGGGATASALTKSGSGTVVLSGNNTYTGNTYMNAGTLTLSGNNTHVGTTNLNGGTLILGNTTALGQASGSGALVINGGTLDSSVANLSLASNNAQNWNGNFAFTGTQNLNLGTGAVTLGGNVVTTVTANTLTVGGAIDDGANTFGLTKAGAGTLALNGANTYGGGTTVSAGTLTVGTSGSLSSTGALAVNTGGTLNLNNTAGQTVSSLSGTGGTINLAGSLTVNDTGTTDSYAGVIAGTSGNLVKTGTGTLALSGSNTYTGTTSIQSGTLSVTSISNSGAASALGNATAGNATITLGSVGNTGTLLYTGGTGSSNRAFSVGAGGGTIDSSGSGNVTLSGGVSAATANTTNFTLTGNYVGVDNTYSGALTNGSGTLALNKSGAGSWVLSSATNTYSGGTTLSAGTLTVASGSSLGANTGNLTVNGGTLNLNATSTTIGALNGSAGVVNVAAGNSLTTGGSGTQSYSGTFSGAGALNFNGSGSLTLGGSSTNSGTVSISNGTVIAQNNNALGTGTAGTTVNSGATLNIDGGRTMDNGMLTLAGGTLTGTSGSNTWAGNMTLTANSTVNNNASALSTLTLGTSGPVAFNPATDIGAPINVTTLALGSNTLTISGNASNTTLINSAITGTGGLTINTPGTVAFNSYGNTYTGTTLVQAGTLTFANSLYTVVPNDPAHAGYYYINGPLTIGTGSGSGATVDIPATSTFSEVMNYTTPVTIKSDGTFLVESAQTIDSLTFSGGGKVDLSSAGTLFLNNTLSVTAGSNATITGTGSSYLDLTIHQNSSIVADATRNFAIDGNLTISTPIKQGGINLTTTGSGVLTLQGDSSSGYELTTTVGSGATLIVQNSSALGLGGDNSLTSGSPSSTNDGTIVNSGGVLQLKKLTTDLSFTNEGLTLNGTGISNSGALENVSGNNTWGGNIFLQSNSTINSASSTDTLTLSGTTTPFNNTGTYALTFAGAGTTDVTGAINTAAGSLIKTDNGLLILEGNNGYQGTTTISQGTVRVTNGNGLGDVASGTTVATGAELQLSNNITVGSEALTLNGYGYDAAHGTAGTTGALNNYSGNNTFGGAITLGSAASIQSTTGNTLTLSGGIDVSSPSHNALLIAGAGNITETGKINIGNVTTSSGNITSVGSGGVLTKNGTGTLTISGANTSALDGITMTLGNITVGNGSTTTLVQSGPLSSSVGTNTLTINSNSTVQAFYAASTTTTFTGSMAGGGTFQKDGTGTLVFNYSFDAQAAGLTLVVSGGEIDLKSGAQIKVGTIHITGNTILDFDASSATLLQSSNLIIDAGVSVTVNNWASETDFWLVQTAAGAAGQFYQSGSPNINAVQNVTGVNPESQITFANWSNLNTTWIRTPYPGYTNNEIRPIPEPATYGVLFFSGCLALLGWRRYSRRQVVTTK